MFSGQGRVPCHPWIPLSDRPNDPPWLDLRDDEALELERGEDIDHINRAIVAGEPLSRLAEQVKHLSDAVTLKSPSCVEAIANALEHVYANPGTHLSFRFTTNARPTIERPSPFRPRRPGIEIWVAVRSGSADIGVETMTGCAPF